MPPILELNLLGAFGATLQRSEGSGKPAQPSLVTGFVSVKTQALLAYLAATRQRHSRDVLAEMFWGNMPDVEARTNLRKALSNLNKLLGSYLDIERDAISLKPNAPIVIDAAQFEHLANSTDRSDLARAVTLYRGELLRGLVVKDAPPFDEWLIVERERLRNLATTTLRELANMEVRQGNHAAAIRHLQTLVAHEPLDEPAHRHLILLLARSGQRAQSLAQFESCQAALRAQLGVPPEQETSDLANRIRRSQRVIKLPMDSTPFIGREPEADQLRLWLSDQSCRVVTITGIGGIGKTRLAQKAARMQIDRFLDGVYFVSLADVQSTQGVAAAVLTALAVPINSNVDTQTQLSSWLRDRELLFVLDNFEHVIDAGTPLLMEWLHSSPQVKLVVTSRQQLRLRSSWHLALDGLPSNDLTAAGVELFMRVAARARGVELPVDADTSGRVVDICRHLEGLPLAIELAAPLTRFMTLTQIRESLQQDAAILASSALDYDPRHRSLHALFEQSWMQLSEGERVLFCTLSVFRGGFKTDAAIKVAGATVPLLNSLADRSLIRLQGGARWLMHDLLRQFAFAKLSLDPTLAQATVVRHASFFADFVADRRHGMEGAHLNASLAELEPEYPNVAAAWSNACRVPDAPMIAVIQRAMHGLLFFMETRGRFAEGEQLFLMAQEALMRQGSTFMDGARIALANVLARRAWFCFRLARFDEAGDLVNRSLAMLADDADWPHRAYPVLFQGAIAFGRGEYDIAIERFSESMDLYTRMRDPFGIAGTLNNLGQVYTEAGRYSLAQSALEKALEQGSAHDLAHLRGHILLNLASLALRRDDYDQASAILHDALLSAEETQQPYLVTLILGLHARVTRAQGNLAGSTALLQKALGIAQGSGDLVMAETLTAQLHDVERAH